VIDRTISRRGLVNGTLGVISNGNPEERVPRTEEAQEAFLGPFTRGSTALLTDDADLDALPNDGDGLDLLVPGEGVIGGNDELVRSLVPQDVTDAVQTDPNADQPSNLWNQHETTRRAGDRDAQVLAEVDWQGTRSDREIASRINRLESQFTEDYLSYLGLSETINAEIPAAQEILRQIEDDTGIRPALLYAVFRDTFGAGDPEQAPLELFLVTAQDAPVFLTRLDAPRSTVIGTASQLRATLTNPLLRTSDRYLAPAQQLYDWLIRPLLPTLRSRQIDNIAIIGDIGLRSVPFAALHDGEAFVIQEFSLGLMPSLALVDTRYRNLSTAPVLALGASEFTSLDPLPAVPVELDLLTTRLRSGETLLNDAFTLANLQAAQTRISSQIIHLATHAEFRSGDAHESYIQLGNDERLPVDTMRDLGWNDPVVDLLVLSACRTALGDERAELGFGGIAVAAGVKTAIASLWYVSDSGTLGLMSEFYTWLSRSPIKAEALRQAQLAMSRGEVRIEGNELVGEFGRVPLPPVLQINGTLELSHPYFWSAFTAIGSPY
jgi:CHAT domain-containing protein